MSDTSAVSIKYNDLTEFVSDVRYCRNNTWKKLRKDFIK